MTPKPGRLISHIFRGSHTFCVFEFTPSPFTLKGYPLPMAKAPTTKFPVVREKAVRRGPPGILGFSALLTPDTAFDEEAGEFTAKVHWNEDQIAAFTQTADHAINALFPQLQEAYDKYCDETKKPRKALKKVTAGAWLEDKLKDAKEGAAIQLKSAQFKTKASFISKKDGSRVQKTLSHYDRTDTLLDGAALKTGMRSIVQPILTFGLFTNANSKGYAELTVRLEGIVVLKNEAWGGGGGGRTGAGEYSDEALAQLLGDDTVLDDDLSAFAQSKEAPAKGAAGKASAPPAQDADEEYDLDDSIPF